MTFVRKAKAEYSVHFDDKSGWYIVTADDEKVASFRALTDAIDWVNERTFAR